MQRAKPDLDLWKLEEEVPTALMRSFVVMDFK